MTSYRHVGENIELTSPKDCQRKNGLRLDSRAVKHDKALTVIFFYIPAAGRQGGTHARCMHSSPVTASAVSANIDMQMASTEEMARVVRHCIQRRASGTRGRAERGH